MCSGNCETEMSLKRCAVYKFMYLVSLLLFTYAFCCLNMRSNGFKQNPFMVWSLLHCKQIFYTFPGIIYTSITMSCRVVSRVSVCANWRRYSYRPINGFFDIGPIYLKLLHNSHYRTTNKCEHRLYRISIKWLLDCLIYRINRIAWASIERIIWLEL